MKFSFAFFILFGCLAFENSNAAKECDVNRPPDCNPFEGTTIDTSKIMVAEVDNLIVRFSFCIKGKCKYIGNIKGFNQVDLENKLVGEPELFKEDGMLHQLIFDVTKNHRALGRKSSKVILANLISNSETDGGGLVSLEGNLAERAIKMNQSRTASDYQWKVRAEDSMSGRSVKSPLVDELGKRLEAALSSIGNRK